MKKIIKKVKKILGLELPYLLEEEKISEPIVFKNKRDNIVTVPKNVEVKIYKDAELENNVKMLANCAINSGMTMNEAREFVCRLGGIKGINYENTKDY